MSAESVSLFRGSVTNGVMPAIKWRTACLVLLALLCGVAMGCAGGRVNARPFFFRETHSSAEQPGRMVTDIEVLHPFFGMTIGPAGRRSHVLRPLYNYQSDEADGSHRLQYLWPFGYGSNRPGDRRVHRLWPLFQSSATHRYFEGDQVSHGFIFPLLFWGNKPPQGGYFALFPVGGVIHGLVTETFSFVLFPLYSQSRQGEYRRHNVLWPFFSWGGTPDGKRKVLRLWPFYVRKWRADTYNHHYVLWPFVRWGTQQWETRAGTITRKYWAFHPLLANQKTYDAEGKLVAWQKSFLFVTLKGDTRERKQFKGWSTLFSLVRSVESPRNDEFRIFPFYWRNTYYVQGGRESGRKWTRWRVPWPVLYIDRDMQEPEREKFGLVLALLYWHRTTRHTGGEFAGRTERSITLFPLASWQSDPDRSRHFWLLSHGWRDTSGGYKRNYRAFFDVFQYHSRPDDNKETMALWRLYHHKRGPEGRYLALPLLMTYDGVGDAGADGKKSVSFLLGLIKRYWWEDGSSWRLFYIPL